MMMFDEKGSGSGGGIEMYSFNERDFSLPAVTVQRTRPKRRRPCGRGVLVLFLVVVPIYFYKQIIDISLSVGPHSTIFTSPMIQHDYSTIKSVHDLEPHSISQWCFRNVYDCQCKDPLVPVPRDSDSHWQKTHAKNMQQISTRKKRHKLDVVFYGDSLVELWNSNNYHQQDQQQTNNTLFDSFFSKKWGGKFEGVAMGISNDRSPNLLWRLKNGELPESLHPAVFWVHIGTQDLALTYCSPELVLIGILGVVEEILLHAPVDSQIVINGIFPRGDHHREGYVARGGTVQPSLWRDIQKINKELKMYSMYRNRVSYFDPGKSYFANPEAPIADVKINEELMPDYFHLSEMGYKVWGEEITKKLQTLITS